MSAKVGNHKSTVCFQYGVQQSLVIAANRCLYAVNVRNGLLIINNGTFISKQVIRLTYCGMITCYMGSCLRDMARRLATATSCGG